MLSRIIMRLVAAACMGSGLMAFAPPTAAQTPPPTGSEAFRWTQATGMVGLGDLPGEPFFSLGNAISADGSVIVGQSNINNSARTSEAFRWTQATGMVGLGDFPGGTFRSNARGVSADGQVVVGWGTTALGIEAYRWTQATGMVGLGDLPGGSFDSSGNAISGNGFVIVGDSNSASGKEAFRWTQASGMVGLGDLPGGNFESVSWGVSMDGSVIVGAGNRNSLTGIGEAFVWTEVTGMRKLQDVLANDFGLSTELAGWQLYIADGISADASVITGTGFNPSGDEEAWIAHMSQVGPFFTGLGDLPGGSFRSFAFGVSADGLVVVGESDSAVGTAAFRWTQATGIVGLGFLPGGTYSAAIAASADGSVAAGKASMPEPSSLLLVGIGLIGLLGMAPRQHAKVRAHVIGGRQE